MDAALKANLARKEDLHPRNQHRARYDFPQLIARSPELGAFVAVNAYGQPTIDFADPAAVKAFNRALLMQHYGVAHWDIPPRYLCPSVPGRADYMHYMADLLAAGNEGVIPRGKSVTVLDIGTGANCIYPIVGTHEYGWRFIGSDIDALALRVAKQIVASNKSLATVECRQQALRDHIFEGIIRPKDVIDFTVCNPPFHASPDEATARARRKWKNLDKETTAAPVLNFGGQSNELWCEGGEPAFLGRMVAESAAFGKQCAWFSSLVSKKTSLPGVYAALTRAGAEDVRTIGMAQGQKISRIVAWTFQDTAALQAWRGRWKG